MAAPAVPVSRPVSVRLLGLFLVGAAVSIALGVYGGVHDPTQEQPYTLFFTATINLKVWFATVAVTLAALQLLLAARLYGKIQVPKKAPPWLGDAHRLTGTVLFLFTLPVAYHCLWALGFKATAMSGTSSTRVLLHSLLGCFFFGVFAIKILGVRSKGLPGWLLPVVGGLAFAGLVGVWLTSSLWFFTSRPGGPLF